MSDVDSYLEALEPERRRSEAKALNRLFVEITGWQPVLYSDRMLGYGSYDYTYASGHSGTWFATGFASGKAKFSIYIMPGYANFSEILDRIGKHKMGKACLYVNKLADIDLNVLAELIRAGLGDLETRWPVKPS